MEKRFFSFASLLLGAALTFSACSDDDTPDPNVVPPSEDLDYTAENASAWGSYMYNTALLLNQDATDLYNYWTVDYEGAGPYATQFKEQTGGAYTSALACIEEMVESGMWNIANEVGTAKIKDPYDKYVGGDKQGGLYAVESWYSFHSRDDYSNNIFSIRNTYYGRIDNNDVEKVEKDGNLNNYSSYTDFDDEGDIAENSMSKLIASVNPELDNKLKTMIFEAVKAIQAIPQPFRNNIDSEESVVAMDACNGLADVLLNELLPYVKTTFATDSYEAQLKAVATQFVDQVILPTYLDLKEKNNLLLAAVNTFRTSPSDDNFAKVAEAWITAREPWEKSEAFLIGPVDSKYLDPNMDSWPLDQDAIVNVLNSQSWKDMEWSENASDEAIEAAQSVRGFHTLEYLTFKNGEPRTVNN